MQLIVFSGDVDEVFRENGQTYKAEVDPCVVSDERAQALFNSGSARPVLMGDPIPDKASAIVGAHDVVMNAANTTRLPRTNVVWDHKNISLDPVMCFVVATRDRPAECAKQVALILSQKDVPADRIQVVVVNDGGVKLYLESQAEELNKSRKKTLVSSWLPNDPRLTLIEFPDVRGPNAARDFAVRVAPTDAVIVEADDHDYLEEDCAATFREAFMSDHTHVVYADHWRHTSNGQRLAIRAYNEKPEYYNGAIMDLGALHMGVRAYRRGLYMAVGGYRYDEMPAGDLGLFLRFEAVLRGLGIVHLARPVCSVCVSMQGISLSRREEQSQVSRRLRWRARCGSLFSEDV